MSALETVDIPAVEIMRSGGPVYAIGSPAGGDYYSREDLEGMAAAHVALGEEIRAPIKLGHSDRQQLLANSGLTKGEMPAAGWLDSSTFRVEDAEDGSARLLADAKAVPRKLADLMEVGAFRTRSSEIRSYTSQKTQGEYPWVVDGLALMGEQVPAIQTLDDVHKLYQRAEIGEPAAETSFVIRHNAAAAMTMPAGVKACSMKGVSGFSGGGACHMHDGTDAGKATAMGKAKTDAAAARKNAAGGVVWDSEDALEDLRSDLNEALNPYGFDAPGIKNLWVRDVARSSDVALVSEGYSNDDDAWVVPFTIDADGDPVPASRDQWTAAEMTWVAAAADLARKNARRAEPRTMPEITLTDETAAALREQLGLEADAEITADTLVEASTARANELVAAKTAAAEAETRKNEASDLVKTVRKLEADVKVEQTRRFELERETDLTAAVRAGKIDPAQLEDWQKDYDDNQAGTRRILERLKADPDLVREFGRDSGEDTGAQSDEEYQRDFERRHGMKASV